jgi:DNA-binding GntR family transcriptional regulator
MRVGLPPARTKSERVFDQLRADIHAGRLPPASRLRYAELCERYGASTGVLREALQRLREQGLVTAESNFGFQVIDLSVKDLQDLTASRLVLEPLALRSAIGHGGVEWESSVLAAHHRLARTETRDLEDPLRLSDLWVVEHAAFHEALIAGCTNRRLRELASSLRGAAELYRRWSLPLGDQSGERDVAAEHAALADAVVARDAELAVALLTAHISRTTNRLLQGFLEDPDAALGELDHAATRRPAEGAEV